jgi:hypothetical protein
MRRVVYNTVRYLWVKFLTQLQELRLEDYKRFFRPYSPSADECEL